jgi:AcrR family transcriptional regulator
MIKRGKTNSGYRLSSQDTKTRILDAAERLFASKGIEGVSVRTVLAEAGVNVALAHYHFGGRKGLIGEVLRRRLEPINERRLRLLDEAETGTAQRPPDLEKVLRAFFAPAIELLDDRPDVAKLLGRLHIAADPGLREFFLILFGKVVRRFDAAVRSALPKNLSQTQKLSRAHFTFGVLIHTLTSHADMALMAGEVCQVPRGEMLLREMVDYCAAGLRASATRQPKTPGPGIAATGKTKPTTVRRTKTRHRNGIGGRHFIGSSRNKEFGK